MCFFFNDTATTEIYTYCHTLSLHDALPICASGRSMISGRICAAMSVYSAPISALLIFGSSKIRRSGCVKRSEEHTSELQSLMRISYAVFCLKKKKNQIYYILEDIDRATSRIRDNNLTTL